jgi:quinol monooxygenase YgiN
MVTYRVKSGQIGAVEAAIRQFVAAIAISEPGTTYDAYRIQGEDRFVHFMAFPDPAAEKAHQTAPYTLQFVEVLYPNCEIKPQFFDLDPISG